VARFRADAMNEKSARQALDRHLAAPATASPDKCPTCGSDCNELDELAKAERELARMDSILRASVPDRWKTCASPVGAVQSYIAEMEQQLEARLPLTVAEVEATIAQHDYEVHGDRARYIVRMTEQAHGIMNGAAA